MGEISLFIDISFLFWLICIWFLNFVQPKKSQKLLKFSSFLNVMLYFLPSARINEDFIKKVFLSSKYDGKLSKIYSKKYWDSAVFCINDFLVMFWISM